MLQNRIPACRQTKHALKTGVAQKQRATKINMYAYIDLYIYICIYNDDIYIYS